MGAMTGDEEEKCRDTMDKRGKAISARLLRERKDIREDTLAGKWRPYKLLQENL